MRLRLEFDIEDRYENEIRSLLSVPSCVAQIRCGFGHVDVRNYFLSKVTDTNSQSINTILVSAIIDTLHDLGTRYGCGGTSDHELVSDVLLSIESGIRNRLEG